MKSLSILSVMKELRTADQNGTSTAKSTKIVAERSEQDVNQSFLIRDLHDDFVDSNSTKMQNLLQEFTKLYTDKLQRVEDLALEDEKEHLSRKVGVLESWVEDLGEQNSALVSTVEDLEREASQRVELLQEKLNKMASVTRDSCTSLREQQLEVNAIMNQKVVDVENESQMLREKIHNLEKCNAHLLEENASFHSDFERFIEDVSKAKPFLSLEDGEHFVDDDFPPRSPGSASDEISSVMGNTYIHEGMKSLHCQILSLRSYTENSRKEVVQKDREILHLQAQLTDLEEKLGRTQMQLEDANETLDHLRDPSARLKLLEFSYRGEYNKNVPSPSGRLKSSWRESQTSSMDADAVSKIDIEARLSNNIDILASRLNDLEEECEEIRDQYTTLKATHDLCDPTINRLQEQLSSSHMSMDELRSILTSEVTERHDIVLSLRKQLDEMKQQMYEANLQLQLKCDVIEELRNQKRKDKLVQMEDAMTNTPPEEINGRLLIMEKERNDAWTNTDREIAPPHGFDVALQISKLENEIAEKNILVRELQSHLASSRQEVTLKDETLYKVEGKLDTTRRNHNEKEDRLHYLNGQLTVLQLEVSRLHGQSQQLKNQLENKSQLIRKLEDENTSLTSYLNEKSSLIESYDKRDLQKDSQIQHLQEEIAQQKMTILTLQDALVATKQTCDKLRTQPDVDEENHASEKEEQRRDLLTKTKNDLQAALLDIHKKEDQLYDEHMRMNQLSEVLASEKQRNQVLREKIRSMQGLIVECQAEKVETNATTNSKFNYESDASLFMIQKKQENQTTITSDSGLVNRRNTHISPYLVLELKKLREELEMLHSKIDTRNQNQWNTPEGNAVPLKSKLLRCLMKMPLDSECNALCSCPNTLAAGNNKCSCESQEGICFCHRINLQIQMLLEELQNKKRSCEGISKTAESCQSAEEKYEASKESFPRSFRHQKYDSETDYKCNSHYCSQRREERVEKMETPTMLSQKVREFQREILESRKHQERAEVSTRAILRRLRQQLLDDPLFSQPYHQIGCGKHPSESNSLKHQLAETRKALEEEKRLRFLLSNDAQIVVRAVGDWLQQQKEANSLLASKFHQKKPQINMPCSSKKWPQVEDGLNIEELENLCTLQYDGMEQDAASLLDNDSGICDNLCLSPSKRLKDRQCNISAERGQVDHVDSEDITSMCSSTRSSNESSSVASKNKINFTSKSLLKPNQNQARILKESCARNNGYQSTTYDLQEEEEEVADEELFPANSLERLIYDLEKTSFMN